MSNTLHFYSHWQALCADSNQLAEMIKDKEPVRRQAAVEAIGYRRLEENVPLLLRALDDDNASVRKAAIRSIITLEVHEAAGPLLQILTEKGPLQPLVIEALSKLGDFRATKDLLEHGRDETGQLNVYTIRALGELGDVKALHLLLESLECGDPYLEDEAAKALGKIGDTRAIEHLERALSNAGAYPRRTAGKALGKMGVQALPALIRALEASPAVTRGAAAEGLGLLADNRAVGPLINALEDPSPFVRISAAEALGEIGDCQALEPLFNHLEDELVVSRYAYLALVKLSLNTECNVDVVKMNLSVLDSEDEQLAYHALTELGELEDKRALPRLRTIVENGSDYQQILGAEALLKLGEKGALDPLLVKLESESNIAPQVVDILGRLRAKEAAPALFDLMDLGGEAALYCPWALIRMDESSRLAVYRSQSKSHLRGAIDWAFARQGSWDYLIEDLHHPEAFLRAQSVGRLPYWNDPRAVDFCITALNDKSAKVKKRALRVLEWVGDKRALPALTKMLESAKAATRRQIFQAIAKIRARVSKGEPREVWQIGGSEISIEALTLGLAKLKYLVFRLEANEMKTEQSKAKNKLRLDTLSSNIQKWNG